MCKFQVILSLFHVPKSRQKFLVQQQSQIACQPSNRVSGAALCLKLSIVSKPLLKFNGSTSPLRKKRTISMLHWPREPMRMQNWNQKTTPFCFRMILKSWSWKFIMKVKCCSVILDELYMASYPKTGKSVKPLKSSISWYIMRYQLSASHWSHVRSQCLLAEGLRTVKCTNTASSHSMSHCSLW